MKVAVIVPSFRHFDYVKTAADSAIAHTDDACVFIVDDASPEWDHIDWSSWQNDRIVRFRFSDRGGLTRSWNLGLRLAREAGAEYAVCTNSDVVFTPDWFVGIEYALSHGASLVGPVTNAPGHKPQQSVFRWIDGYKITDDSEFLADVSRRLRNKYRDGEAFVPSHINGFCMVAKVSGWWNNKYSDSCVFNPAFSMTRNEDELQGRWKEKEGIGFVRNSFIFHYRGVSRNSIYGKEGRGWYRKR